MTTPTPNSQATQELKPCAHCGSATSPEVADTLRGYVACCTYPSGCGAASAYSTSREAVVNLWNTRADTETSDLRAALEDVKDRITHDLTSDDVTGDVRAEFIDLLELITTALTPKS